MTEIIVAIVLISLFGGAVYYKFSKRPKASGRGKPIPAKPPKNKP